MCQEESLIQSSSVSLGMHSQKNKSSEKDLKPWVLLVCGDFGFTSEQPQLISSATIQDFIQTCGAEINGLVKNDLPESVKPFCVKTKIKAFSDFSEELLLQKTPVMKTFFDAREILDMISRQKITPLEGKSRIVSLDLPESIKGPIIALLGAEPRKEPPMPNASKSSFSDYLMSMIDISEKPANPLNNLINAIGSQDSLSFTPEKLAKSQQLIDTIITRLISAVRVSSHYSTIASSWYALKNLLKKIGRNKQISVYIDSSLTTEAVKTFQRASAYCIENALIPDLILWSHELPNLSLLTIEQLNTMAALSDNMKSMLLTSIAAFDPVLDIITSGELGEEFEQSETWNAFQMLRSVSHSRSLALCAPAFRINTTKETLVAGGAWLLADHWVSIFLESNTPFNFSSLQTTEILDDQLLVQVSPHRVKEIAQYGLTFARAKTGRIILSPRVVVDSGEDERFGFVGFNIFVNRVMRIAGEFLSLGSAKMTIEHAAESLREYLIAQLEPYEIVLSGDSISVQAESVNSINVCLNSDSVIDGNYVRFEFSIDY